MAVRKMRGVPGNIGMADENGTEVWEKTEAKPEEGMKLWKHDEVKRKVGWTR